MDTLPVIPGVTAVPASAVDPERLAAFVRRNREHLFAYLPEVAEIDTVAAAQSHLASVAERLTRGDLYEWHLHAGEELCGSVRLNYFDAQNHKVAIGYYLGAEYQGRGIATAAARAVIGYAFESLKMNRIELRCAVDNLASIRVAERLGFLREGELREAELLAGRYVNLYVYSLLRSEFASLGCHAAPHPGVSRNERRL